MLSWAIALQIPAITSYPATMLSHLACVDVSLVLQLVDHGGGPSIGWAHGELVLQQQLLLEPGILQTKLFYGSPACASATHAEHGHTALCGVLASRLSAHEVWVPATC